MNTYANKYTTIHNKYYKIHDAKNDSIILSENEVIIVGMVSSPILSSES